MRSCIRQSQARESAVYFASRRNTTFHIERVQATNQDSGRHASDHPSKFSAPRILHSSEINLYGRLCCRREGNEAVNVRHGLTESADTARELRSQLAFLRLPT